MLAAIYARVNTGRQVEKDVTIPDQLQQMRQWCVERGHQVFIEYIESKQTATNDYRPEFLKMIAEATMKPRPYDLIVVYTQSQFCRDATEFYLYERKLLMAGVSVISITQDIGSIPSGDMMRRMFSVFDEYQRREHGKQILRSMKENARQGFFNGSKPPFGYRIVETDVIGRRGKKKRLEIDPAESVIVQRIFSLYGDGKYVQELDANEIAEGLNVEGLTYRGMRWNRSLVHKVLANATYKGEYYFNTRDSKAKRAKPESEWVRVELPALVRPEVFEIAAAKRQSRAQYKVVPSMCGASSPLSGLPS